jgi:hypothetical protein
MLIVPRASSLPTCVTHPMRRPEVGFGKVQKALLSRVRVNYEAAGCMCYLSCSHMLLHIQLAPVPGLSTAFRVREEGHCLRRILYLLNRQPVMALEIFKSRYQGFKRSGTLVCKPSECSDASAKIPQPAKSSRQQRTTRTEAN